MEIPTVVRDDDFYPDEGEALDLGGTPSAGKWGGDVEAPSSTCK